jgi:sugar lactone lactonase YvrE
MKKFQVIFYLLTLCFAGKSQAPDISYSNPPVYTAGATIVPLIPTNVGGEVPTTIPGEVTTFAGSTKGYINGPKNEAKFEFPIDIAQDVSNNLYISDYGNDVIRKISPEGIVTTLAGSSTVGSSNGTGNEASFYNPHGIAVDHLGNVYVADSYNNMIRKITPDGVVSTLAGSTEAGARDGMGSEARFNRPEGIDVDNLGNVYVADYLNHMIRKVTPEGMVTTIAGTTTSGLINGIGSESRFYYPQGLVVDKNGNLYIADTYNEMIRRITPEGIVTSLYNIYYPDNLTIDTLGNLYVNDQSYNLWKITAGGIKTKIAGEVSRTIFGIEVDSVGNIYVADAMNHMILKITQYGYSIKPELPSGLIFEATTGIISGTPETGSTNCCYTITAMNRLGNSTTEICISIIGPPVLTTEHASNIGVTTATANGCIVNMGIPDPIQFGVVWSKETNPVIENSPKTELGIVSNIGAFTSQMGGMDCNTKYYVRSYAINNQGIGYGNEVYFYTKNTSPVIDYSTPEAYVKGIPIQPVSPITSGGLITTYIDGFVTTYAGTGTKGLHISPYLKPTMSIFDNPIGTAVDKSGNVYFVDIGNHAIHMINDTSVVCIAGTSWKIAGIGVSLAAGIAIDSQNILYIADAYDNSIYKLIPGSDATLLAGGNYDPGSKNGIGTQASFNSPCGIAVDNSGILYVADRDNNLIRKITPEGEVSTLAGSTTSGSVDGSGSQARFNCPNAVTIDAIGNLYIADLKNNMIRKISPEGEVITFAGNITAGSNDGKGILASFNSPSGITVDNAGYVYVADYGNNVIRKISPDGDVKTIAGSSISGSLDDYSTEASFNGPYGISVDKFGNLYVADRNNNKVRKVTQYKYAISPSLPSGICFDDATGIISGTPSEVCVNNEYKIVGTNSGGSDTATVFLNVREVLNITTEAAVNIGPTSASAKGYLGFTESTDVTQYGFVWDTNPSPSIDLPSKVELGSDPSEGLFISPITGLMSGTKYYLRSFATFSLGTVYGNNITFNTRTIVSNNNISDEKFEIYPNPAYEYITIKCISEKNENIAIFDLTGKQQNNFKIENDRINIENLMPGMYILRINHSNYKFIKKPN